MGKRRPTHKFYSIENGKIGRSNLFCPRCGLGVFMADHGDWWACGKCGDRYVKQDSELTKPTEIGKNINGFREYI
jgi:small subunit ribosomal protein S27Ae